MKRHRETSPDQLPLVPSPEDEAKLEALAAEVERLKRDNYERAVRLVAMADKAKRLIDEGQDAGGRVLACHLITEIR